ncbi:cyclopropane fatty acyl phospholipid synthase [Halarcobacter anaerophilus]|uniref:cyclopropane fatty acyl phospholipid synthase n=1 Tax=Halarcobacter anaerophilus TaxID=877500 RepID=UPI0011634CB2|nr:cyclopropane fatty acyl phospholipid synthase [Halarcobacter anaerophilus]QDF30095.1 cyclopropane fatty acyl phospholipid synthase [Halarcobacter anaerophilus]
MNSRIENKAKLWLQTKLEKAGIVLDGDSKSDPKIHNQNLYSRVIREGSLGLGEAYMEGWWDCCRVDEMICKVLTSKLEEEVKGNITFLKNWLIPRLVNLQSKRRSFQVGEKHYNAGNDLYKNMLDKTMSYSCGYWKNASCLYEAQIAKLDLICKKLQLKPNESVLEIGCGWGSFAVFASQNYKVKVNGITVSSEQKKYIDENFKDLPIKVKLMDYRNIQEKYDKVVSIGMFEHVGEKNYNKYFQTAFKNMKDEGIFLLHTIGNDVPQKGTDPWINKYIFPNGQIPSLSQISKACEKYFVIEDVHNFGMDYDKTLMSWFENFDNSWDKIKDDYNERFYRMWSYYLKSCAGAFRSRRLQLFQIVLRKRLKPLNEYQSFR